MPGSVPKEYTYKMSKIDCEMKNNNNDQTKKYIAHIKQLSIILYRIMLYHTTPPHYISSHFLKEHRTTWHKITLYCDLSSPKPEHTTGGSGRSARRGDKAGSVRTGCQQNCSPRKQASLVPPKTSRTYCLNVSPEARTSEILCKPNAIKTRISG